MGIVILEHFVRSLKRITLPRKHPIKNEFFVMVISINAYKVSQKVLLFLVDLY